MKTKILSSILVFSLALLCLAGCGQSKKENPANTAKENIEQEAGANNEEAGNEPKTENTTVKIGFVSVDGSDNMADTVGYARDHGYIDEELQKIGVTAEWVSMVGAGPAINEALASKNLDLGYLGDIPAIIGKANGIDTKVIAVGSYSQADILVRPDSDIKTITDLKGKKVATGKGQYMHAILASALKDEGLTTNDIEFVNMTAQDAVSAFLSKSVDSICIGKEAEAKLVLGGEAKVIGGTQVNPGYYSISLLEARTEFAEENPEIMKALIRAVLRAKAEYEADNSLSKKQWVNAGYSEEGYEFLYPNNDYIASVEITDEHKQKTSETIQFLKDNELINQDVDIDLEKWFDSGYYDEVVKE